MTSTRSGAVLVATVLAVIAAACGSDPSGASGGGTSAASVAVSTTLAATASGIAATLEQYREDELVHMIEVQVVNQSTRTVRLTGLRFVWAGVEPVAPATRADQIGPGQLVDLPIDFGQAICGSPPRADDPPPLSSPAVAEATVTYLDTGQIEAARIPITDTRGVLPRIYRRDCRQQSVTSVADVAWDPSWIDTTTAEGRPASDGTLRVTRRSGNLRVVVTEVNGSVLLIAGVVDAPPRGTPLVVLAAGQREASLPVRLVQSGRCEAHVLAESKHTFLLPVGIAVGDQPVVLVDVIPDDAAKVQLSRMINRSCGVG